MIHPQIDISVYPILGEILSHGYLTTGTLAVNDCTAISARYVHS